MSEIGEGIDEAIVYLEGPSHSYELTTDYSGHISTVLFPEKYDAWITKDQYSTVYTELSAEKGGVVVDQIQLLTYSPYEEEIIGAWPGEEETPYEEYNSSSGDFLDADFLIGDWSTSDGMYFSFFEDGLFSMQWGFFNEEGYWGAEPIDENSLYIEMEGSSVLSLMSMIYGTSVSNYHFEILKNNNNGFYLVQVYGDYTAQSSPCKLYFERLY